MKKKRTYKTRDGEVVGKQLRQKLLDHDGCSLKKTALAKLNKLQLCDIAKGLGLLSETDYVASLARKSEGRKCYLTTMVRERGLLPHIDDYVSWWSQTYARGTIIANGFAISDPDAVTIASLMDLTFLKKVLLPERYDINELPVGLSHFMNGDTRRGALATMASTVTFEGVIADQGTTYIARRFRGAIKGHVMTHLHTRIFDFFSARFHGLEPRRDLPDAFKKALIDADFSGLRLYPEESWRIVKLRSLLGLESDDVAGLPFVEPIEAEDEADGGGDNEDDDDAIDLRAIARGWIVHRRLCDFGIATLLPLADLRRHHAIIDARIAFHLVKRHNKDVVAAPLDAFGRKTCKKIREVPEDKILAAYFTPSVRFLKRRKAKRRKSSKQRKSSNRSPSRRQYIHSGVGRFVPKDGEAKSFQTDSVAATLTFDVPIRHEERVIVKRQNWEAMLQQLSEAEMSTLLEARRIAVDPGDVNTVASIELGRAKIGEHREPIEMHLSKKYYERRTLKKQHARWETSRRRNNPAYQQAIDELSRAGTWKSTNIEKLDIMINTKARAWPALREELVFNKEHVEWKMRMYRKRRMVLDQTARRMVDPKQAHVVGKKKRGIIVGYGNGTFGSMGPRLQMIRAVIRALKTLRKEGRPVAMLVFVDEFRTTMLCHRCHRRTKSPRKKNCKGYSVEDHRFRDCSHCGDITTPTKRWGRDSNAALNILRNLSAMIEQTEIPVPFRRETAAKDVH